MKKQLINSQLAKKLTAASLALAMLISPGNFAQAAQYPVMAKAATTDTTATDTDTKQQFSDTLAVAQSKADYLTKYYGLTSVQYALVYDGKIVLSDQAGYGNVATKKKPSKDSIYGIGSISKVFTSVAIMQLVDEGKINLDAPVTQYVSDFKMKDDRYKDITVRMLLNHSSGLMGNIMANVLLFYDKDTINYDNFLEQLSKQRLKAKPGAFSVYCNDGFTLAEIVVERVTKMSFTEYLNENIFKPLNLSNTKTPQSAFNRATMAKTYLPGFTDALPADYTNFIGAGGLYSTAEDLCKFAQIFMNDTDVLSKKSVDAMAQPEYRKGFWGEDGNNSFNFGLGWDSINLYPFNNYNIQAFCKGGDTLSYHGSLITIPKENMAVAVLSSGGSSTIAELLGQEILLAALKETGTIDTIQPEKELKAPTQKSLPESYMKYEGYYANYTGESKIDLDASGTMKISSTEGKEGAGLNLVYTGDGLFVDNTGSLEFKFIEKNNHTYLYLNNYTTYPGISQTYLSLYYAQKLEANPLSEDVKKAWDARNGKEYFVLNNKYTSQNYLSQLSAKVNIQKDLEGYANNSKIIDKDTAITDLEIPLVMGRDLMDITFFTKNGIEYANMNDLLLVSEEAVKQLSNAKRFKVTIASDGYAKWFKIGSDVAGKTVKIDVPKKGSFAVYDKDGTLITFSLISNNHTVKLPKNGKIIFAGDVGASFTVNVKK
ncbi:MAG TPA: serine hydrolase domain-containing protein [Lachnospiraceae bacterium]|nr:serine hydrolase domain-containing protein [Lachnospiraceae bacterium]